jgi:hypothetical protein
VDGERYGLVYLMASSKFYPEMDSKAELLEPGRRPAKWPLIRWFYALTTISAELAPTTGASQVSISN